MTLELAKNEWKYSSSSSCKMEWLGEGIRVKEVGSREWVLHTRMRTVLQHKITTDRSDKYDQNSVVAET